MFIKIKRRGQKTYYELAHSQRRGRRIKQFSIYLGPSLALTAQEWFDVLASAKGFQPTIQVLIPVLEEFIHRRGLPRDTIRGLQDAARSQWRERTLSPEYHLLGVKPGATIHEIKTAFRRLSRKHHPDVGGDSEAFRRLVVARNRLLGRLTPTSAVSGPSRG
jgi:hypothetical protein